MMEWVDLHDSTMLRHTSESCIEPENGHEVLQRTSYESFQLLSKDTQ